MTLAFELVDFLLVHINNIETLYRVWLLTWFFQARWNINTNSQQ